ncbi:MAG: DUF2157 domain-containing protein [Candidatus Sericytochromatia bacterium]|nr:DUF2157 domain-containing protein [Candidatus Sericytochromatia bacterium]
MKKQTPPLEWLHQELPFWVESGWLQPAQAEALQRHYTVQTQTRQPLLNMFALLGALLIGIGVILLLGYNWSELSRPLRAGLLLTLLFSAQCLSFWALWRHRTSTAWREGSACFQVLALAAAIALVGQTYHIPGDLRGFLLSCVMLSLPLIYLLDVSFVTLLCTWGLGSWYLMYLDDRALPDLAFWGLFVLLLPQLVWRWRQQPGQISTRFLLSPVVLVSAAALVATFGDSWLERLWFVILPVMASLYYLGGQYLRAASKQSNGLIWLGQALLWLQALLFSNNWAWREVQNETEPWAEQLTVMLNTHPLDSLGLAFLMLAWLGLSLGVYRQLKPLAHLWNAFPLVMLLSWNLSLTADALAAIVLNIYLLALGVLGLWQGLQLRQQGTLTGSTLLLAVLIVLRFMDAEMSLMGRGLAFMGVGLAFLLTNLWLARRLRPEAES